MTPDTKRALVEALRPVTDRVRRDISAVKFSDGSRWTKQPLDDAALLQHVNGGPPRGACPIKEGESVTMLALLDLDSHRGETAWPEMQRHAAGIAEALELWGMHVVPFRSSGGKGIHLYMLWDQPQDAYSVRTALTEVLEALGYQNKAGKGGVASGFVEVFPRQDAVGIGENGNQFILPLGGHSVPLTASMEPMTREMVEFIAWPTSTPVPRRQPPVKAVTALADDLESIAKVTEALAAIPNDGGVSSPDYDAWRDLAFAVHEATGGSEEGRQAFADWSEQNPVFDEAFFDERVWEYIKDAGNRHAAITRSTLYGKAREHGWGAAAPASAEGFGDLLDVDDLPARPLPAPPPAPAPQAPAVIEDEMGLPGYQRKKTGEILATIGNVLMAVRRSDVCLYHIGHDRFRDEIMKAPHGTAQWTQFTDADYVLMREHLERNDFDPIGKEQIRDAVLTVAAEHSFDSAILWLQSLPRDGARRCETFLSDYLGAEDTPYVRAVSLYLWSALAGRVMDPGCQADMTPILIGAQGSGKTSAVRALVPAMQFFCSVSFHESDDNLARKMRGKIVAEIGELRGLGTKEIEAIKDFISRTHEEWVPKYREFSTQFPRRLLFVGTTNKDQFLADDTGNRRWLPVKVGKTNLAALRRDAALLWAEARDLHCAGGVRWQDADRLAAEVHDEHTIADPWEGRIEAWLRSTDIDGRPIADRPYLLTADVLIEGLRFEARQISRREEMRVGSVLRALSYIRQKRRVHGRSTWAYSRPDDLVIEEG